MHNREFAPLRVDGGMRLSLSGVPTAPPEWLAIPAERVREEIAGFSERLNALQELLHAAAMQGVLLILQGMDASGKDGAIRRVFSQVSPLGVRAEAFGPPSDEERCHDYLWRVHSKMPKRGELAIFNRSHYEDVLVTRVRGWIDRATCERRYAHIRHFERMLSDEGIRVIKCYLHISKQEQKKRLQARIDDPAKQWKLQPSDFNDRRRWDDFIAAYEETLAATSTDCARWHVIPADSKLWRDRFLIELLVNELQGLNLAAPKPAFDVASLRLE